MDWSFYENGGARLLFQDLFPFIGMGIQVGFGLWCWSLFIVLWCLKTRTPTPIPFFSRLGLMGTASSFVVFLVSLPLPASEGSEVRIIYLVPAILNVMFVMPLAHSFLEVIRSKNKHQILNAVGTLVIAIAAYAHQSIQVGNRFVGLDDHAQKLADAREAQRIRFLKKLCIQESCIDQRYRDCGFSIENSNDLRKCVVDRAQMAGDGQVLRTVVKQCGHELMKFVGPQFSTPEICASRGGVWGSK